MYFFITFAFGDERTIAQKFLLLSIIIGESLYVSFSLRLRLNEIHN